MNSNSKIYTDPCSKKHDDECETSRRCIRKIEKQKFVLLKVGDPTSTPLPALSVVGTTITVASLTVNTRELDDPEIKIDFTSNIVLPVGVTVGTTLTFQVNKFFINPLTPLVSVPVGPAFIFTVPVAVAFSDAFTFFVKDPDDFGCGLVRYTVTVTIGGVALAVAASINNATLAAIIAAEED